MLEAFRDVESYAATTAHELTHWTAHPTRLNREFGGQRFGDTGYAREEVVAELGAAYLCADLGITLEPREDHSAYLAHWIALWYQRMVAVGEPHSHETAVRQEDRRGRRKTGPVPVTNLAEAPDDDQPPLALGRGHDSARSSTQSTYSRRSENSHAPSVFTNVSL